MGSGLVHRVLIAATLLAGAGAGLAPAAHAPSGLERRVPWDPARLAGSPDPPPPYAVEPTFTKLAWKSPIFLAAEPGTDGLWVVHAGADADAQTKPGSRIVRIKDDPAADAAEVVLAVPNRLVYSVCFHPGYAANRRVYVFSNGPAGAPERSNRVARYTVGREPPHRIDPASEELVIEWKSAGHDGGDLAFGPDGLFYVTTGDGSGDSDARDTGQALNDLLGGVLRIDVDRRVGAQGYAIPPDNPFINTPGARPETWAYGLRNPWRMAIDPGTGQLWVGNNGQDRWETAHLVRRGENYGWSVLEGSHPFYPGRKLGPTPPVPPTIEHSHAEFRSLTGGVVYRGAKLPDLDGSYIYGDYSSGRIWEMKHDGRRVLRHRELADTALQITAFRVDHRGELLIADHGGGLYRLVPAPKGEPAAPFPTLLSRTGLFASTPDHRVDRALIPYSVNAPGWADGARAERFMAVPGGAKVGFDPGRGWNFPDGTALVQTLTIDPRAGVAAARSRVETRVLLRRQGEWAGYSYRWNPDQTDATLVAKAGEDAELPGAAPRRTWRFPARSECMACHSRAANFVLGVTGAQLNREHDYGGTRADQLRTLDHIGLFAGPLPAGIDRLIDPADGTGDLERRVRTYLHVNCSTCHVEGGGGNAKLELALATPRGAMNLLGARPQHDTFGMSNAMLVAPGEPGRSVLLHRLARRGPGGMPPLGSNRVDEGAVTLVRDWIAGLKPDQPFVRAWGMGDLLPALDPLPAGRSIESGRKAFRATGCVQCHRFEGEGGSVGPDLAGVGRRLGARGLLESILLPSKVIADEYAEILLETADGAVVSGRIVREDDRVVVLRPPAAAEAITVAKAEIRQRRRSGLSNMPAGIVDVLAKEQVLDLLAYLLGDPPLPTRESEPR